MSDQFKETTDKLTDQEIAVLVLTPLYLNDKIAYIDGKRVLQETVVTLKQLADNLFFEKEKLEIARKEMNRIEDLDDLEQESAKEILFENFKQVVEKFPEDEQKILKQNMLDGFIKVAKAAGAGFFGIGEKIDVAEINLINDLIEKYEIDTGGKSLQELLR